jgi:hypothetical protein
VFAFPLPQPIGKADQRSLQAANQPVSTAFSVPFGDDYRGGVSLAMQLSLAERKCKCNTGCSREILVRHNHLKNTLASA